MKKTILTIAIAALCSFSASAKIWRVNNAGIPADYTSLQDALTAIPAGDTIYLEGSPNTYALPTSITKKVTIVGPGYFLDENPNTLENKSTATVKGNVTLLAAGITWEGLVHDGSLYIGADNIMVRKCYLEDIYANDNNSSVTKQINNTIVTQCYIADALGSGYNDAFYNAVITNNIFPSYGIRYFYNSLIENNTLTTTYSIYGILNCSGSTIKNNIVGTISNNTSCNISNNFTTAGTADYITGSNLSTDGKYQLATTSGARTAGTNGSECGAFGGASPYVLSGLPSTPHIYEIDAPNAASAASGLKVTLKIGTEK